MNIHEHQAKDIFREYNIPVSSGEVAYQKNEIENVVNKVDGPIWVVKAQIHAGGRGKGGGVKVVDSPEKAIEEANKMYEMNLITPQTGPSGRIVKRIYIEHGSDIEKELYLSCLVDRATSKVAFIVSKMGGMDIEAVAEDTPENITTVIIEPSIGVSEKNINEMSNALEISEAQSGQFSQLVKNLYQFFIEKDASLVEINPLIVTTEKKLLCLDAKVNFDENALFKHPEIENLRDPNEEDIHEQEASKHDLAYIKLDGNIGCMVNGAGLAMASLDIIKLYGGEPANFLDVGGGASKEKVTNAFKIILSDKGVKGILVNIFGGIMRCNIIAEGIIAAAKELEISVPLVVRLEGTNVEEGKAILEKSDVDVIAANDLDDAAKKIVKLV
tara:strand:- start:83 stop:1240 length:1158 start_codon:yes stop_codon:yes gene_type:complete